MDWRERVYGGRRGDLDIPEPSNSTPKAPQAAQERSNGESGRVVSILAFDAATVESARARLRTMHELGQSWYELGQLFGRPAGTIQHWASGRGKPDDDTIEAVLKSRLHYVAIEPGMTPTPACPDCGEPHVATAGCGGQPVTVRLVRPDGTSKRKRYWRPCLPHDMSADQKRRIMEIAEE